MKNQTETKGFRIVSISDPSVGIFETEWTLTGDLVFDSNEDLEHFRSDLKQIFERTAEIRYVETFEELEARLSDELTGELTQQSINNEK